jgi:hypothetical protein
MRKKLTVSEILDREVPDLAIPDPIPANEFQPRNRIECIDNRDTEDELTIGVVYTIEEITDSQGLRITNDLGNHSVYYTWHFKSVEHGPFKKGDEIQWMGEEGVTVEETTRHPDYEYNTRAYVTGRYTIIKADDTHAWIQPKPKVTFKIPNQNLKFHKRIKAMKKNPLQPKDKVKCIKDHTDLILGNLYTIEQVEGDYVWLLGIQNGGDKYRYNLFKKWDKLPRESKHNKKFLNRMKLADHVRYYVNRKIVEVKPTALVIRKALLEDKIITTDVTLKDIKNICDQMFMWK